MISSRTLLEAMSTHAEQAPASSADRPVRLATIDPTYNPFATWPGPATLPKVTFEGETVLDDRQYAVLNGYIPMAGDRVLMIPTGTTYSIVGKMGNAVDQQGFWADADSSGVEFGGGSFISSEEGLTVVGGGDFTEDIVHGTRNNRVPEILFGLTDVPTAAAASLTKVLNFSPAFPVGTVVHVFTQISGSPAASASSMSRGVATNTQLTINILKSDAARVNYVAGDNIPVFWLAVATPAVP